MPICRALVGAKSKFKSKLPRPVAAILMCGVDVVRLFKDRADDSLGFVSRVRIQAR